MSIRTGFGIPEGMDFTTAVEKANEQGYDFVELIMDGHLEREVVVERRDELVTVLSENQMELTVHLPMAVDIGSPFDRIRDANVAEVQECIRLASDIGANKGVLHPYSVSARMGLGWPDEKLKPHIIESVKNLVEFASGHDFEICAENLPNSMFTLANFDTILNETQASMTLDTGHARLSGFSSADIKEFVDEYIDDISHFHLNDNRVELHDRNPQDEHLPLGAGTLDFETALGPVAESDWNGTVTLEIATWNPTYMEYSKRHLDTVFQNRS